MGPAMSSALATRPSGIPCSMRARPPAAYGSAHISVSTHPGATQLTVMPGAHSMAIYFVIEISAPFVAA